MEGEYFYWRDHIQEFRWIPKGDILENNAMCLCCKTVVKWKGKSRNWCKCRSIYVYGSEFEIIRGCVDPEDYLELSRVRKVREPLMFSMDDEYTEGKKK